MKSTLWREPSLGEGIRGDIARALRVVSPHPSRAQKVRVALTNRGFQALMLYRLSRACLLRRVPILPLILTRIAQTLFAIDISPSAFLGPGVAIVHGFGVVIGSAVQIEGDCCIFHGVPTAIRSSNAA